MELSVLLSNLNQLGVVLGKEGDRLKVTSPEGAITPELADALRQNKKEILTLLDDSPDISLSSESVDRVEDRLSYMLSPSQERNLFSAQNGPGLPTAYTIKGYLDRDLLLSVLDHIVARHAALRTIILDHRDSLMARVNPPGKAEVTFLDFSEEEPATREAKWRKRMVAAAAEPFILDQGPLYRFQIYRINEDEHILVLVFSQIVFDGTSFDVFQKELAEGYSAFTRGAEWPFPPLQIEYMDYVGWKYNLLNKRRPQLVSWWKGTLGTEVPDTPIPLDHPRPSVPDYKGAAIPLMIPVDFADLIRDLAKRLGVTTQIVMLGSLFILAGRLSGRSDGWIATPVEGRQYPSFEPLIGTFVNMILLKVDLDADMPFAIFIPRLRDYCMTAYDNQDLPIEELGLRIRKNGRNAPAPLFQMEFSYQQVSQRSTMMGPLSLSQVEVHGGGAANELTLWVKDWGHMINGAFEFSATLFDNETIIHWLGCYLGILRFLVEHPDAPLRQIEMLDIEGSKVRSILEASIGALPGHIPLIKQTNIRNLSLLDSYNRPAALGVWANLVSDGQILIKNLRLMTNGTWEIDNTLDQKEDDRGNRENSRSDGASCQLDETDEHQVLSTTPTACKEPSTERQRLMLAIWKEAIGRDGIGINDNFFELGGHSILAISLIRKLNTRLGTDYKVHDLFDSPTVEGLINKAGGAPTGSWEARSSGAPVTAPLRQSSGQLYNPDVGLDLIASIANRPERRPTNPDAGCPYGMKESWVCKWILAPLYRINRGSVRALLQFLIFKLERGELFTITLRKLYTKYHDIHIGEYSCGGFDTDRIRSTTRIGRYSTLTSSVVIFNANHPSNTISTNAIFYHPAFRFTKGYELERTQVTIGNDVFIGQNAKVLYPTTKIGDGAIIAAGSLVIDDVPPYAVVGGYPAEILKYRFSKETIEKLLESRWWDASMKELSAVKDSFEKPVEGDKIL